MGRWSEYPNERTRGDWRQLDVNDGLAQQEKLKAEAAAASDPKKRVVSEDEWNQTLANMGPDTAFTGTGTPRRQSRLRKAATGALQRVALFSIGGK